MSTTSTKSGSKPRTAREKTNATAQTTDLPDEMSERTWRLSALAILVVGAILRLYDLALVPLHHDEGVNGNFLVSLVNQGTYVYNPENYHGPTLYYFSAIIPWLTRFLGGKSFFEAHGLTTFNIRFVTAAFGVATIGLALLLRKRLGTIGALSAAALIAISPGAVYLSRYFIHESLYVFFTLGIIVAAVKHYDTGATVYAILAALSAGLMVATKETWIINGPVLLIALITTTIYFLIRAQFRESSRYSDGEEADFLERAGGPVSVATVALMAFTAFIVVNVLFYSSFFKNYPKGVNDALQTLSLWRKRTHEHEHRWWQYIYWLLQEEGLIFILGGVGALIAVWRANNRFALYIGQFAFGLLAAYSLVGYKTPWISLNFIVPLALISGYALNVAFEKLGDFQQRAFFFVPAALIVLFCGYQLYQLNFVHYDDDQYVYVYAHTRRETLVMLDQIDRVANQLKTGNDTGIALLSPEYWPLPWYFRNYHRVGYYQKVVDTTEPIIIASRGQEEEMKTTFGERYQQIDSSQISDPRIDPERNPGGSFNLRPGVDLLLYVRKDVAK
ncbi:MAG TPA: flippase activity-associated protein Agl23 [Pyrinomonadaceae bacterium]